MASITAGRLTENNDKKKSYIKNQIKRLVKFLTKRHLFLREMVRLTVSNLEVETIPFVWGACMAFVITMYALSSYATIKGCAALTIIAFFGLIAWLALIHFITEKSE